MQVLIEKNKDSNFQLANAENRSARSPVVKTGPLPDIFYHLLIVMDLYQSTGNQWVHRSDQGGKNLVSYIFGGIDPPKTHSIPYRYNPTRARPTCKISDPMTYYDG